MTDNYNLSVAASELNAAIAKANSAAPQSTTYTKAQVDVALAAKLNTTDIDSMLSDTSTNPVQSKVVQAAILPLQDFIFGAGTALAQNEDLNNYNQAGKLNAPTGAIAQTIMNTPWTASGFTVFVIPFITTTAFLQILIPNTVTGKWYRRRYTQGAWSNWIEYDGTEVT